MTITSIPPYVRAPGHAIGFALNPVRPASGFRVQGPAEPPSTLLGLSKSCEMPEGPGARVWVGFGDDGWGQWRRKGAMK